MRIVFTVRGNPAPQGSMRAVQGPHQRFPVLKHDNKHTKPWRQIVGMQARVVAPPQLWAGAVQIVLRFYLQRPRSLPKRVIFHIKKPDIDKLTRATLDALKGVIYVDDSQVVAKLVSKDYGDPPRMEVELMELEA